MRMFETKFGFLPEPHTVRAAGILVEPLADFDVTKSAVMSSLNPDGFLYPPQTWTVTVKRTSDGDEEEMIPHSRRPAHLYVLPSTHKLMISQPVSSDVMNGDASFVVHLLSYLWGFRLQIDGWHVDGRISIKRPTHHVIVGQARATTFLQSAYSKWCAKSTELRAQLSTLLYLHAKAPSYEWTWEEFFFEYVATDALFAICKEEKMFAKPVGHADRIQAMADSLGVWCPRTAPVNEIVRMRNSLFHQGIWANERPGYNITNEEWDRSHELRALNQRLIAAYLGGSTEYTMSPWINWRHTQWFR